VLVEDAQRLEADLGHVAFLEEHEAAGHRQQRGDVRRNEILVLADADHDRAAFAREHDTIAVVLRHDSERIRAFKLRDGGAHCLEQVVRDLQVIVDPVRNDLGIGLRRELVAGLDQLGTQFVVVLDDAVVDDRDAVLRDVRVRVALARHTVRRPPRVRDAEVAVRGVGVKRVLEFPHLADGAQPLDVAGTVQHGDTRGVVAAIFEPPQALEEHRNDVAFRYGTNDSTHGRSLLGLRRGRGAPF
jgi:hypothetical protein